MPKDFETLVYLSQILQAEGIRYGVEHWRRYPQRVSGTLYCSSMIAGRFFLVEPGLLRTLESAPYAARRFYAPVLLSIENKPSQWISGSPVTCRLAGRANCIGALKRCKASRWPAVTWKLMPAAQTRPALPRLIAPPNWTMTPAAVWFSSPNCASAQR